MRTINSRKLNLWPIYLKNPTTNVSSFAMASIIQNRLDSKKLNYKIESVSEITDLSYCPLTKIYLKHKSFNDGTETHFFKYNHEILGTVVIRINEDHLSNWGKIQLEERIFSFIRNSLSPVELIAHDDPNVFHDLHSLKIVMNLLINLEGEEYYQMNVRVYFDVAHELGDILLKNKSKGLS